MELKFNNHPLFTMFNINIGDILYTKVKGGISQCKVKEMVSRAHFPYPFYDFKCYPVRLVLLFPDGCERTYTSTADFRSLELYRSVQDLRENNRTCFYPTSDTPLTEMVETMLRNEYGLSVRDGKFVFYKCTPHGQVRSIDFSYFEIDHSDKMRLVFSTKYSDNNYRGTVNELISEGIYPTYERAYNSFEPAIIKFA